MNRNDGLLRRALRIDGLASGAAGVAGVVAAMSGSDPLGIPGGWLVGAGVALVGWTAALLWLASRPRVPAVGVWIVLGLNAIVVVDSVVVVVAGWWPLTGLGTALLLAMAAAVVGFMDLEYLGLRRAGSASAPGEVDLRIGR